MAQQPPTLAIDARPRGPGGLLAAEMVLGRCVLSHLLDLADSIGATDAPVAIHARLEEHRWLEDLLADRSGGRFLFATGPPTESSAILRTDRLYDPIKLRRALKRGRDPESAVLWRLDRPKGLAGAEAELTRRRTYQPLGRYWALGPARLLARRLCPTRVRPNAVTLASAGLMLAASGLLAFSKVGWAVPILLALALVLDTADGHLARLQGTATPFGRWLDAVLDELGDMALHAAIAWAAFVRDGHPAWLVLGMAYGMGKYLFVVGTRDRDENESSTHSAVAGPPHLGFPPCPGPASAASGRLAGAVRLAGHADVRWHLWIVLAAFGRLDAALVIYTAYYPARAVVAAVRKAVRNG